MLHQPHSTHLSMSQSVVHSCCARHLSDAAGGCIASMLCKGRTSDLVVATQHQHVRHASACVESSCACPTGVHFSGPSSAYLEIRSALNQRPIRIDDHCSQRCCARDLTLSATCKSDASSARAQCTHACMPMANEYAIWTNYYQRMQPSKLDQSAF